MGKRFKLKKKKGGLVAGAFKSFSCLKDFLFCVGIFFFAVFYWGWGGGREEGRGS